MSNIVPSDSFGNLVPNYDRPTFNPIAGIARLGTELVLDTKEQIQIAQNSYEMRQYAQDVMIAGAISQIQDFAEFQQQRGRLRKFAADFIIEQGDELLKKRRRS